MAASGLFSVFVGQLNPATTKGELNTMFERFGTPKKIYIADRSGGSEFTYAFVRFVRKESAIESILALNGCMLRGRPVSVEYSKENPEKAQVEQEIIRRRTGKELETKTKENDDVIHKLIKLKLAVKALNASLPPGDKKRVDCNQLILYELSELKPKLPPTSPHVFQPDTLEIIDKLDKEQSNADRERISPLMMSRDIVNLDLPWLKSQSAVNQRSPHKSPPQHSKQVATKNHSPLSPGRSKASVRFPGSNMPDLVGSANHQSQTTSYNSSGHTSGEEPPPPLISNQPPALMPISQTNSDHSAPPKLERISTPNTAQQLYPSYNPSNLAVRPNMVRYRQPFNPHHQLFTRPGYIPHHMAGPGPPLNPPHMRPGYYPPSHGGGYGSHVHYRPQRHMYQSPLPESNSGNVFKNAAAPRHLKNTASPHHPSTTAAPAVRGVGRGSKLLSAIYN